MRTPLPTLALDGLDRLLAALQSLPVGVHGGAVLALLAGLLLWMFGAKVLKPVFALIGLSVGSLVGAIGLPLMGIEQVGGYPSVYVGLGIGAIAGAIIACVLFRFALAATSAVVFAAVGLLGAAAYLDHETPGKVQPPASLLLAPLSPPATHPDEATAGLNADSVLSVRRPDGSMTSAQELIGESVKPAVEAHAARARAFAAEMGRRSRSAWDSVEARDRLVVLGGGVGGAVLGALFGLLMPKRSAALVTSLFGSAAVLGAAIWLAGATDAPGREALEMSPGRMGVVLAIATLVGMVVQLSLLAKGKSSSGAKPAAP